MRYLNKIVFINSAHVKYAEISLDGNVHFIGTQGVGKSTLLRAILFFYNADKSKLGINTQGGQRSFDEFYLPKQDSYIIYEVQRENGRFFIITFLSQGRAAYRFVDAEYRRSYFVDDEGNVAYEWGRISERIGNRFKSNIVRHYATYLNILYGNRQEVEPELRRFSLMESPKFQNIPRTIQNIFLNQSLESRVIKDTIIQSMDFSEENISLGFYREKVKDFRQEYEDIWKWYRKEKNGRVKVQDDADGVISRYTLYESSREEIATLGGELQYALGRDRKLLPQVQREQDKDEKEMARQKRLLGEEESKHRDEREGLVSDRSVLDAKLKDIKKKRQHYEAIGIDDIIRRIKEKEALGIRLTGLDKQMELLTAKSTDVRQRYASMIEVEEANFRHHKALAEHDRSVCEAERAQGEAALREQHFAKREALQDAFLKRQGEWQERHNALAQERAELRNSELKIRTMDPYAEAKDEAERRIRELTQQCSAQELRQKDLDREIQRITQETELMRQQLESDMRLKEKELLLAVDTTQKEADALDEMLQRQKGSLIEWLSVNVDNWEESVGKVLDEEQVLYNTSLNPAVADATSNTVFGISLDVANIERQVRTPEDVKREKEEKESLIAQKKAEVNRLHAQLAADIEQQNRKPSEQLRQLRKERMDADVRLRSLPQSIAAQKRVLEQKNEELQEWRTRELAAVKDSLAKVEASLENLQQERGAIGEKHASELSKLDKELARKKKANDQQTNERLQAIDIALWQKEEETELRKKSIEAQMDAELRGAGVDVEQLASLRKERHEVEAELKYIDDHLQDYHAWLKDTEELFSHEPQIREQQKTINQKLDDLESKYEGRRRKYNAAIAALSQAVNDRRLRISLMTENISKVDEYVSTDYYRQNVVAVKPIETAKNLGEIYEALQRKISLKQQYLDKFREAVSTFKKNFSAQNTFGFRTEFNAETDYIDFAVELNEFVANRKIEEYRTRTSETYGNIIRRISREVGDLLNHRGAIESTIADINRDFKDNNFVGVIKDIELRAVQSSDRLMQHLFTIQRFSVERAADLGAMNLFTSEESHEAANRQAVELLMTLMDMLDAEGKRDTLTLADTFKLEFKVRENDNDTGWVEKLSNVGSDGTDVLVKAMVNIMLINVFKRKISRKFGDFRLHCMMDEIGKLHPNNVKGILQFASARNIYLINSSPTTYTAEAYRYTYLLAKDSQSNTLVKSLLTIK